MAGGFLRRPRRPRWTSDLHYQVARGEEYSRVVPDDYHGAVLRLATMKGDDLVSEVFTPEVLRGQWPAEVNEAVERATERSFRERNRLPETSYEKQAEAAEAARVAEEQAETRRAAEAADRYRQDLDHADRVMRLLQRRSELEAVRAFEERHLHTPRRLARFVKGER
jgi:hypothetical protein